MAGPALASSAAVFSAGCGAAGWLGAVAAISGLARRDPASRALAAVVTTGRRLTTGPAAPETGVVSSETVPIAARAAALAVGSAFGAETGRMAELPVGELARGVAALSWVCGLWCCWFGSVWVCPADAAASLVDSLADWGVAAGAARVGAAGIGLAVWPKLRRVALLPESGAVGLAVPVPVPVPVGVGVRVGLALAGLAGVEPAAGPGLAIMAATSASAPGSGAGVVCGGGF